MGDVDGVAVVAAGAEAAETEAVAVPVGVADTVTEGVIGGLGVEETVLVGNGEDDTVLLAVVDVDGEALGVMEADGDGVGQAANCWPR